MDDGTELNTTLIYDGSTTTAGSTSSLSFTTGPTMPNAGIYSHCSVKISSLEFAILGGVHNNISRENFDMYNFDDQTWTVMPSKYNYLSLIHI